MNESPDDSSPSDPEHQLFSQATATQDEPADAIEPTASEPVSESGEPSVPQSDALEPASDDTDVTDVAELDQQVVIGIRTREASRIYHFAAPRGQIFVGDYVVINRARGDQLARVVTVPDDDAPAQPVPRDVRPIERLADAADRDRAEQQSQRADLILHDMRSASVRDNLGLYPVAVELNLDGDRGTAWFQAADHVDFRSLLEDIEQQHDVRLHMQQANQRERARLVDGYDICGLRLCCSSWMTDFPHVGIRVAKDQDLSLNPDSISGVCGRLLCCLTFEHEVYREMRGSLPRVGKRVSTPAGMGKVIKLNVLKQQVTIALDDHAQRVDVPADEIGLAVRTEDAPNQALVEAERSKKEDDERAAALRQAAAPLTRAEPSISEQPGTESERPKRRRRRRSRKPQSVRASDQGTDTASERQEAISTAPTSDRQDETSDAPAKRSGRRRRRRKSKIVNQGNQSADTNAAQPAADLDSAGGDAPRPRRRRRRSRQQVNQPTEPSGGQPSD